jgi:hypothetical protein
MIFKPETKNELDVSEKIAPLVDVAIQKERAKESPRSYLGASRWGEACERKLAYEFHKTQKDSGFSGRSYRIFDAGHDYEDRVVQYMRMAGFILKNENDEGKQIGFFVADGKLGGHCDGIIYDGPVALPYPLVFECKSLNDKSWNDTKKKGVKESKPVYYAQIQTYCAYFDVPNGGLFVAINKNDGEIYYEHVPFDARTAQDVSDRALRVVKSSRPEELSRITDDPANFQCRFCDYSKTCHNKLPQQQTTNQQQAQTAKPFWIK